MVYQVVAVKKATVRGQEDGKGDTLVHKVESVVANSEAAAIALYTKEYLMEADVANLEVTVRNF